MKLIPFLFILFLLGCEQPETVTPPPTQEPIPQPTPEPEQEPEPVIDADSQLLLDKFATIDNYRYTLGNRVISVRKQLVSIEESTVHNHKDREYNSIYLDTTQERAFIACTGDAYCGNANDRTSYSEVSYDLFKLETYPPNRMQLVAATLDKTKVQTVEGTTTYELTFTDHNNQSGIMLIDHFWGFPYLIHYDDGETTTYRDVGVNGVKETDVTLKSTLREEPLD